MVWKLSLIQWTPFWQVPLCCKCERAMMTWHPQWSGCVCKQTVKGPVWVGWCFCVSHHDQPLKAFHDNECECYGMTDIKAGYGGFFGIGIMVAVLKHIGITDCARKMLKMSVRTTVGWVKHHFSIRQGMQSVSVALTIYRVIFFYFSCCDKKHLVIWWWFSRCSRIFWVYVALAYSTPAVWLFLASFNALPSILLPALKAASHVLRREQTSSLNQSFCFNK